MDCTQTGHAHRWVVDERGALVCARCGKRLAPNYTENEEGRDD